MKALIVLALIGYIHASPIELWTGPTRATIRNPECTNDLCRILDENGNSVNLPDKNYAYPSYEDDYIDRCFYTCSGGKASCQCCNDDSKGKVFYNEHCDRCVYESEKEMTECPTTKPWTHNDPCTYLEDKNYPNYFCQNLHKILGPTYDSLDGDYPFSIVRYDDIVSGPLDAQSFLSLPRIPNAYISCVGGIAGWCRPCASWDILHWVVKTDKEGKPILQCGYCEHNDQ